MTPRLPADAVDRALAALPGWQRVGEAIRKEVRLADFQAAIAFVVRVAFKAETAGHHPDIDIRWNRVVLTLTTHDAGGLTDKDLMLAREIEALLARP
ncbi:MAG TPA: 4a-hydroxytetrahydrobiopterin dehydratase [Thermodesulfobacteriota bacterium]|nr:4a-hydroxytetrahydrobiopterin dehydratase [Thermodesulfobacteriota bacterium]